MPQLCTPGHPLAGCDRSGRPSISRSCLPIGLVLAVTLVAPASQAAVGEVVSATKISQTAGGFGGALSNFDRFGDCAAYLGDVDGDGVGDLAVAAGRDDDGGSDSGAVWILFLNANGSVKGQQKISQLSGGFLGQVDSSAEWGECLAEVGDLNYDGVPDLAVADWKRSSPGVASTGAVWILFLNADGTVRSEQLIDATDIPGLAAGARFGRGLGSAGDVDGDGVMDLAVGTSGVDAGGNNRGGLYVVFLEPDGWVKGAQQIADGVGGLPTNSLSDNDFLGIGKFDAIGDLDGNGVPDLVAGAQGDDTGGTDRGAVWILLLNADGTVAGHQKIASGTGGFTGTLDNGDQFGDGAAGLGDIDGDGVPDLAVSAGDDDDGAGDAGAVWVLFLNANGTVKGHQKISATTGGFAGALGASDHLGFSLAALPDLDGLGTPRLAATAIGDDDGGSGRGAVWVLELDGDAQPAVCGDFLREAAEECDDGNTLSADGCSAACEEEEAFWLRGTASGGGTVSLTVSGEGVATLTSAGQSAASVLNALATEIASTPALQVLGITAQFRGQALFTTGEITASANTDAGLVADERDDLIVSSSSLGASFVASTPAASWEKVSEISLSWEGSPGIGIRGAVGTFDVLGTIPLSGSGVAPAGVTTDGEPRSLDYSAAGVQLFGCDQSTPATTDLQALLTWGSQWVGAEVRRDAGVGIQCSGWHVGQAKLRTLFSAPHYPRPIAYGLPYLLSTHTPYAYLSNGAGLGWLTGTATITLIDFLKPASTQLRQRGVPARTPGGRGALNLVSPAAALNITPLFTSPPTYSPWGTYATQASLRLRIVPEPVAPLGLLAGALGTAALLCWRERRG